VEDFLNHHLRLMAEESIDCGDLFDGDEKEKILVYSLRSSL